MSINNFQRNIARQILRNSPTRAMSGGARNAVQPAARRFITTQITQQSKNGFVQKLEKDLATNVFKGDKKMFSTQNITNIGKESVTE